MLAMIFGFLPGFLVMLAGLEEKTVFWFQAVADLCRYQWCLIG
ncbi:hypothetical protein [Methylophaga sp.]|nr:hypothetical protein [Methylophaga sp.]